MEDTPQEKALLSNIEKTEKKKWQVPCLQVFDINETEGGCACGLEGTFGFISS